MAHILIAALVVALSTGPLPSDLNRDGAVGQDDFGHIQACLGYVAWEPEAAPGCNDADLTKDGRVNQDDVEHFMKEKALGQSH